MSFCSSLLATVWLALAALDARADSEGGPRCFILERDGAVFQGLTFHDTPSKLLVEMRFTDLAPKPGAKYRVLALNTAGLKSEPSAEAVASAEHRSLSRL